MKQKKADQRKRDQDLDGAGVALKRAARQARKIAEQTNTPLVIYKDGHVEKRIIERKRAESGK